jgi:two-component system OmpR family response regulator
VSGHEHVLVVEDEEHLAAGIKYNLDAEGYRVTSVGDGAAALRLLRENRGEYQLVVLDLMLPGMSGYEVCESLRQGDDDVPVLILSARTLAEDRTRGFEVGADQYLTKPFDLDEFLSRVKGLLAMHARRTEHRPSRAVTVLEFGRARVDFETFEATMAGKPVRPTRMELDLLRYFAENPSRVISRHELLESVWDMPGHVSTRAPDQFIHRLRKMFEPDPSRPRYFLTIRDAGYRFLPEGDARESRGGAESDA